VVQSAQDRLFPDFTSFGQSMPAHRSPSGQAPIPIIRMIRWQPWPQAHVWAAFVIMANPFFQHHSQMTFAQRNQKVQTLAPNRPHQSFAVGVGLRRPNRRPQHPEANPSSSRSKLSEKIESRS
jgi:hypothetical protein